MYDQLGTDPSILGVSSDRALIEFDKYGVDNISANSLNGKPW